MAARVRCAAALALLLLGMPAPHPATPEPAARSLETAALDFGGAVDASGLTLKLDFLKLHLTAGALVPVRVDGASTPLEWLFVGQASLRGRPPAGVEQDQLAYFTGERVLDVRVTRAVVVHGRRWDGPDPASRPAAEVDEATRSTAAELFGEWAGDAERGGNGTESALVRALVGDPVGLHFASVWADTAELGRLFATLDPGSKEPVTLGSLRLYEMKDFATSRQRKRMRRWESADGSSANEGNEQSAERRPCGRRDGEISPASQRRMDYYAGAALPWLSYWVKAPLTGADPDGEPPGFEPEHYEIDLRLEGEALDGTGTARIRLRPNLDGLTVVPLDLALGLDVCSVTDAAGRSLAFYEREREVLVALGKASRADEALTLTVQFAGRPVVKWLARRTLLDTIVWHPHAGRLDRATYDVTLRWPEELKLLASGRPVDGGVEDGLRWTRRRLDVPAIGFSFEVDAFDVVEDEVGHVKLSFGFYDDHEAMTPERRAEIVKAVKASLLYYETTLGRLAIDHLAVVVTDRGFSQGLLGFLTLAQGMLNENPLSLYDNRTGQEVRLDLIAHEVAHQWWGNQVGWESYRDQWLSEALATFSAARFMHEIAPDPVDHLRRTAQLRRTTLGYQTTGGQPTASVGSVLLGWRVLANFGPAVYNAVVYVKGAAAFSTLAERLGPDATWKMLGSLAETVNHRVIRSETFFSAFERMSGQELQGFYEQYVRGAGMPLIVYEYAIRDGDAEEAPQVEGVVHQLPPARYRFAATRTQRGWDIRRRVEREPDIETWQLSIPFVVDTSTDDEPSGFRGDLAIAGARTEFAIPLERPARRLELDPQGVVLADVTGAAAGSAESLFRRGEHALSIGRTAEARRLLDAVLKTGAGEAGTEGAGDPTDPLLAARARIARARLLLDAGDLPAARADLRAAEKLSSAVDPLHYLGERTLLKARLELIAGRPDEAAALLNDFTSHYAFELTTLDVEGLLNPDRASHLMYARGEMLALLALSQHMQGTRNAALLVRMADMAGVDMTALSTH